MLLMKLLFQSNIKSWIREGSGSGQIIMGDKGHNQMHESAVQELTWIELCGSFTSARARNMTSAKEKSSSEAVNWRKSEGVSDRRRYFIVD